jgi:hypothetical protein
VQSAVQAGASYEEAACCLKGSTDSLYEAQDRLTSIPWTHRSLPHPTALAICRDVGLSALTLSLACVPVCLVLCYCAMLGCGVCVT